MGLKRLFFEAAKVLQTRPLVRFCRTKKIDVDKLINAINQLFIEGMIRDIK